MVGGISFSCRDNPWWLRLFSVILCTMAALTGAIYLQFTQLEGYDYMTDLYNMQDPSTPKDLTGHHVRIWTIASIAASAVMFFTGTIGWVAQANQSLMMTSAFNLLVLILAVFFLARVSMMMSLQPMMMGIVDRELAEWCQPANRASYSKELDCARRSWMDYYLRRAPGECAPECQSRVDVLRTLGGCDYLERICDDLQFVYAGHDACLAADLSGELVTAPTQTSHTVTTQKCCQFACALQQQSCKGYSFKIEKSTEAWHGGGATVTGICSVVRVFPLEPELTTTLEPSLPTAAAVPTVTLPAALPTLPPAPTLEPPAIHTATHRRLTPAAQEEAARLYDCRKPLSFQNSTFQSERSSWPHPMLVANVDQYGAEHQFTSSKPGSTVCMAKGKPMFLYQVLDVAAVQRTLSIADCVLLFLAFACGLQYAYSLATRRRGKKGLCAMLGAMLLPCLSRNTNRTRKLVHDRSLSRDDLSGSESSDSSSFF